LVVIFLFVFLFWDTWLLNICTAGVGALCIYELFKATDLFRNPVLFWTAEIFTVASTLFYDMPAVFKKGALGVFLAAIFLILICYNKTLRIEQTAMAFLFCLMVPYGINGILLLRDTKFGQVFGLSPLFGCLAYRQRPLILPA
jgi:phosphatidate cytidylyltransferase